eukprot:m.185582 g.185582  ORF g.185582 m.185582 type:complete len:198 (+) comp14733_c0_seq4:245-838(+)
MHTGVCNNNIGHPLKTRGSNHMMSQAILMCCKRYLRIQSSCGTTHTHAYVNATSLLTCHCFESTITPQVYHPDSSNDQSSADMFHNLTEAYKVLSQPALRKAFDAGQRGSVEDIEHAAQHQPSFHGQRRKGPLDYDNAAFNFREFYQRHYGDAIRREAIRKKRLAALRQFQQTESGTGLLAVSIVVTGLVWWWQKGI